MLRIQYVETLALEGDDGIPELIAMLADPDPKARRDALFGLGQLGPAAEQEIETVRARLTDENPTVRSGALSAFWRISSKPDTAVAAIGPLLADADQNVRQNAKETLLTAWREEAQALRNAGGWDGQGTPDLHTSAALLALLKSETPGVRSGTLWVLSRLYLRGSAVESAARELVDDSNVDVQNEALLLLIRLDAATIAELRAALRHQFPPQQATYPPGGPVRSHVGRYAFHPALSAIARRGGAAAELVPDIVMVLDRLEVLEQKRRPSRPSERETNFDLDAHVDGILRALRAMQSEARSAAPHLLRRIDELHDFGRIQFARTLATIGAEPEDISKILVPIIAQQRGFDPNDNQALEVRRLDLLRAGRLLVQVDPQEARRQALLAIQRLGADKKSTNKMALFAIHGLALQAQEARSQIEPLLKHPDLQVSGIAAEILKQLRR